MNIKNLYNLCKILNTQFLSPRIKLFFKEYVSEREVFIYSFQDDPNICQLSLHKEWDSLIFAWIQPNCVYIFKIPKEDLILMNLSLNHADKRMIDRNELFKHSLRLSYKDVQNLDDYLIEILEGG